MREMQHRGQPGGQGWPLRVPERLPQEVQVCTLLRGQGQVQGHRLAAHPIAGGLFGALRLRGPNPEGAPNLGLRPQARPRGHLCARRCGDAIRHNPLHADGRGTLQQRRGQAGRLKSAVRVVLGGQGGGQQPESPCIRLCRQGRRGLHAITVGVHQGDSPGARTIPSLGGLFLQAHLRPEFGQGGLALGLARRRALASAGRRATAQTTR
mmetsp:Transcript_177364/g.568721  ORF Transcript_177364/g.568721 Transcript_177364/m.568721 type:complete len:209 (-) Transcript_177364:261-887(-)